jgi:hypothetical protein
MSATFNDSKDDRRNDPTLADVWLSETLGVARFVVSSDGTAQQQYPQAGMPQHLQVPCSTARDVVIESVRYR